MQERMWKAAALAVLISAWGNPAATAGAVQYTWGPLSGSGTYSSTGVGPFISYTTTSGYLDLTYDPNNILNDVILGYVGDPVDGTFGGPQPIDNFSVTLSGDYLTFADTSGLADATFDVVLAGTPGPLAPDGLPESLAGFLAEPAGVYAAVGSTLGTGFFFRGSAADSELPGPPAPEPSSLVMLTLGLGGAILVRRGRHHPDPDRTR